jgi:hypothetical protein
MVCSQFSLDRNKEFKQAKETQRFNPKFTPTKDVMSPLRIPQRVGYHQEPLFLFQPPQRKIGAHKEFSTKRG